MRLLRFFPILAGIALFASRADELHAQVWPKGRARIVGTVIDTASMRPIIRTRVCRLVPLGPPYGDGMVCAQPDTTGHYVFDSLPGGQQVVTITCSGTRILRGRVLRVDTLVVHDDETARIDVRTTSDQCDMRPFIERRRSFSGHWVSGFEESTFRPCNDSIRGWLKLGKGSVDPKVKWPPNNDAYYPTVFIRFRGTLRGPWRYGHLGASGYEYVADTVLEVSSTDKRDCAAPPPSEDVSSFRRARWRALAATRTFPLAPGSASGPRKGQRPSPKHE